MVRLLLSVAGLDYGAQPVERHHFWWLSRCVYVYVCVYVHTVHQTPCPGVMCSLSLPCQCLSQHLQHLQYARVADQAPYLLLTRLTMIYATLGCSQVAGRAIKVEHQPPTQPNPAYYGGAVGGEC